MDQYGTTEAILTFAWTCDTCDVISQHHTVRTMCQTPATSGHVDFSRQAQLPSRPRHGNRVAILNSPAWSWGLNWGTQGPRDPGTGFRRWHKGKQIMYPWFSMYLSDVSFPSLFEKKNHCGFRSSDERPFSGRRRTCHTPWEKYNIWKWCRLGRKWNSISRSGRVWLFVYASAQVFRWIARSKKISRHLLMH